ncbi:MAG: S-adenosylmethionine:tRNA ribosyltransferase-isomerase [Nakamurella sp.]
MTALLAAPSTTFSAPDDRTATEPVEYRGLARDEVRLLVAGPAGISHARFRDLPSFLLPGDLLVVNTSATLAAEVDGQWRGEQSLVVHVATDLGDGTWVAELRTSPTASAPVLDAVAGELIGLRDRTELRLLAPYPRISSPTGRGNRLWRMEFTGRGSMLAHLERWGRPIAYGYLAGRFPLADYQTVFATTPGSAEMPSAGRPFTAELVTRLICAGVAIAPIVLHTGVSSQDAGEAPQPEWFSVPPATARVVTATRNAGGRVIAVGTTVTRALESAAAADGTILAQSGWTRLVVEPSRGVRVVDGLVTGWHNPDASHLLLVEAVAGAELTQRAYDAAVAGGYRWHEFGDAGLLLRS